MTRILITLLAIGGLLNLTSCTKSEQNTAKSPTEEVTVLSEPTTAAEVLDRSIAYHDPEGQWSTLNGTFYFDSHKSWEDSLPKHRIVTIDVANDYLMYENVEDAYAIKFDGDNCETVKGDMDCAKRAMIKNFYTYIWGLPMKLKDPNTALAKDFEKQDVKGVACYMITVQYEKENYRFYIDSETFKLVAFDFIFRDKPEKGEIVYLAGEFKVAGMQIPASHEWLEYFERKMLGITTLTKYVDLNKEQ